MAIKPRPSFTPKSFLAKGGNGRSIGKYRKDQIVFSCPASALLRALSYVDAPVWQGFFYERSCNTVGCSHMSGLRARLFWPLALMISAD